jgi:hypothetical protein
MPILPTPLSVRYTSRKRGTRATGERLVSELVSDYRSLSPTDVAVTALATFRLVRIVTTDDFPPIELARTRLIEWAGKDSAIASLIGCSWCSGAWISLAVVALALRYPAARKVLLVPAVSGAVGLLATADAAMGRSG